MKDYYKVFDLIKIKDIAYILIGMVFVAIFEVIGIASIIPFMAAVSDPNVIENNQYMKFFYDYFLFENHRDFVIMTGLLLVSMLLVSNAFKAFMGWMLIKFSQIQSHNNSIQLLESYLSKPYVFFIENNTTNLSKNIFNEVDRAISGVIYPMLEVASKLMVVMFIMIALIAVDYVIALTSFFSLGLIYVFLYKFFRVKLSEIGLLHSQAHSECYKISSESMLGIKEIKLQKSESEYIKRYSIPSLSKANYKIKSSLISMLPSYLLETIVFGGVVLIVVHYHDNNISTGEMIPVLSFFTLAGYRLLPALQAMYRGITNIRYNLPALDILTNDLPPFKESIKEDNQIKPSFNDALVLKNISYSYPGSEKPSLYNIDLTIKPNTTIGFVGTTGAGKTTLIDLFLGLLTPKSGEILVDGLSLNSNNLHLWQRQIGYIPQSIFLSDDSIESNIAFSVPFAEINRDKVVESAKLAKLDKLISTLPDKYQTKIGEKGVRLSGGERQRIGIARALYTSPSLLILDEATSALDGITEKHIIDSIQSISHEKTILMIAHRLTTVKECDIIYMLENGRITDSGTYDELIAHSDIFKNMSSHSKD